MLPRAFSDVPAAILIVPVVLVGGIIALVLGPGAPAYAVAGGVTALFLLVIAALHYVGFRQGRSAAAAIAATLARAQRYHDLCLAAGDARRENDRRRAQEEYDRSRATVEEQWDRADDIETEFHRTARKKIETQAPRVLAKIEALLPPQMEKVEAKKSARIEEINREAEQRKHDLTANYEHETASVTENERSQWAELEAEWKRAIVPIYQAIADIREAVDATFPPWDTAFVENWVPPTKFNAATKFAQLEVDLQKRQLPAQLLLPGPVMISLPVALTYADKGSLLFETNESVATSVIQSLNNIILRLLSTTPPGKLSFTIIDPVGLGQNFAGFMHLADYEESLINRRIWTQRDQIEERLAELGEHIEKVIQMYLRNEYATINEYNEQAGSVAEKYYFIVVADFPANFSELAAKRLQSIALSGPRCGIYTFIHWDERQPLPDGFVPEELRKNSLCLRKEQGQFVLDKAQIREGAGLVFDQPPDADLALRFIHKVGQSSIDSNRVEVPFAQVAPKPSEMWSNDTTNEVRIAVGRTGATKLQYLAIGKGTRQHALFAGKTGSGKSTLFHVIITNLALACSPGPGRVLPGRFQEGRRIQMLRIQASAACKGCRHRERS
jgi:DNA segregation ATPase FtsK/SpoIIIE-like protein